MLTPQAIKDQEFQTKFRGFDPIEVQTFLEMLADDFFELIEENSKLEEGLKEVQEALEQSQKERNALEVEVENGRSNAEDIEKKIEDGYRFKDEKIAELTESFEELKKDQEAVEQDLADSREEVAELESKVDEATKVAADEQIEADKLRSQISVLEEQVAELKQEGVDFKSTILVAQKFAEELKEKAGLEAEELMESVRKEADEYKELAEAELARLSGQIESLGQTRDELKKDLTAKLTTVLESLEIIDAQIDLPEEDLGDKLEGEVEDELGGEVGLEDIDLSSLATSETDLVSEDEPDEPEFFGVEEDLIEDPSLDRR